MYTYSRGLARAHVQVAFTFLYMRRPPSAARYCFQVRLDSLTLPTMASPLRQALLNRTNANYNADDNIIEEDLLPSSERKRPLVVTTDDSPVPKRVKIQAEDTVEEQGSNDEDFSDDEDDDEAPVNPRRLTTFDIMNARMGAGPSRMSRLPSCEYTNLNNAK